MTIKKQVYDIAADICEQENEVKMKDIYALLPNITQSTIRDAMNHLTNEGKFTRIGKGCYSQPKPQEVINQNGNT